MLAGRAHQVTLCEQLTRESTRDMTPERPMQPKEGRMAVAPVRSAGAMRLPSVSVPTWTRKTRSPSS